MAFKVKRVYEEATEDDGLRVLVDRLWPRGLSMKKAALFRWAKELSPSKGLRQWYAHDHSKWDEFQRRYAKELTDKQHELEALRALGQSQSVTLLFSSRELEKNNAHALLSFLESC